MKLLLKQSFKSLFESKVFLGALILVIFVTGGSYTFLQSTANSFNKTYDSVMGEGRLHDTIVKTKFTPSGSVKLKYVKVASKTAGTFTYNIVVDKTHVGYTGSDFEAYINKNFSNGVIGVVSKKTDAEAIKAAKDAVNEYLSLIQKDVENGYVDQFTQDIREVYKDELDSRYVRGLSVQPADIKKPTVKVVEYDLDPSVKNNNVNKMVIYDGTDKFTPAQTDAQMEKELRFKASVYLNTFNYSTNKLKGFRWTAQSASGETTEVTDPSSYEAIVSPSYANENKKQAIDIDEFIKLYNDNNGKFTQAILDNHEKNVIYVDNTPYFITGVGTTPDFSYPIIDEKHPTTNTANEAIVFVSKRGYERVYDAFRTNPKEEYISIRFKDGVSAARKAEIKSLIEGAAKTGQMFEKTGVAVHKVKAMTWPKNINIVTSADDEDDLINLTQERTLFLGKLKNTTSALAFATTTLLIIFVSSIVILLFKAIISMRRKSLATLIALGYSRTKIAIATALAAFLIIAIPTALGYIIGHFMQYAMIGIFDNFWTLPTYGNNFSLLSLLVIVVIPASLSILLIFLITLIELRYTIPDMLGNKVGNSSSLVAGIMKPFKFVGIKTKYAISLMFTNIGRLILVAVAAIISITTITISISNINKADTAYQKTIAMTNYKYQVDLYSPTTEGGQYKTINEKDLYDSSKTSYEKTYEVGSKVDITKPHWHVPSTGDSALALASTLTASNDNGIANYLNNALQTKAILNKEIAGLNPWEIAEKLMPDNQKNTANQNYVDFVKQNGLNSKSTTQDVINALNYPPKGIPKEDVVKPYTISYNNVIVNSDDEKYTYIDAIYQHGSDQNKYHVIGFNNQTKYLNVPSNLVNKLQNYKGSETPILINKYVEADLNLKTGDVISIDVLNKMDRFIKTGKVTQKLKVVGVLDTYNDKVMYTLQKYANNVIGLDSTNGFNGIFTGNDDPAVLTNLSLYSPSGIYIGTDTISGIWETKINDFIKAGLIKNPSIKNAAEFVKKYSRTPFVSMMDSVDWKEISKHTFESISNLSSKLIVWIQFIALTLSILFAIIITTLLINSNRKKIATLWALGYRKREIIKIFTSNYILPLIIAIAVAIPVSIGILAGIKTFVMHFGHILIPFGLVWYAPVIALGVVATIFIASTVVSISSLKGDTALHAFKGD